MANNRKKRLKPVPLPKRHENAQSRFRNAFHPKQKQQVRCRSKPTPTNPFEGGDNILLVGEGDFSFAGSLALHHSALFASMTATTFETREQLLSKYPQARKNIELLDPQKQIDVPPNSTHVSQADVESSASVSPTPLSASSVPPCTVMYAVDARKLSSHPRLKRRRFSKIVFNFPHVGGKSTDVNRQVRYNQELVHSFLESSRPLLSGNGSVLVTLFEGEPYSLWNIRDLARSVGLSVKRSFLFDASVYPGYAHARTLGNLKGRDDFGEQEDLEEPSKRKGSWRGEDRIARTYEFGLKYELPLGSKRKRRNNYEEDSMSEDET